MQKDKALRDNLAFMLKELRKVSDYVPRRGNEQGFVYDKNNQCILSINVMNISEVTKATLENLLIDCKPTDYISINSESDYDGYDIGYSVVVHRNNKESDDDYYQTVLQEYLYLKNQSNVTKVNMKAQTLGLNLTEYQVNELARVFKENE